jgi:TolB-like protein
VVGGCASGPGRKAAFTGAYTEPGKGGEGKTLAVLQPESRDGKKTTLPETEQWLVNFVQSNLTSDFQTYTRMRIVDRQTLNQVLQTQAKTAAQAARQKTNEYIAIGELANADYLLTGIIERINQGDFNLILNIVKAASGELVSSFNKPVSLAGFRSLEPLKEAFIELASGRGMGITLTEEGKAAILRVSENEAQGAVSLAKGIAAEQGNSVERLIYLTNAVAFDSSQLEAINLLASTEQEWESTGAGAALREDRDRRAQFETMMKQFESHYNMHPPFEVIFIPKPVQFGQSDYAANEAALQFSITLRQSVEFQTMQKVLAIIFNNLKKTKREEIWGFGDWPWNAALLAKPRTFVITAELVNDKGKVLDRKEIPLNAQIRTTGKKSYADTTQNINVQFNRMNMDLYGDDPTVRITRVDTKTFQDSLAQDYIRVSSEAVLPRKSRNAFMLWWCKSILPGLRSMQKKVKNDFKKNE